MPSLSGSCQPGDDGALVSHSYYTDMYPASAYSLGHDYPSTPSSRLYPHNLYPGYRQAYPMWVDVEDPTYTSTHPPPPPPPLLPPPGREMGGSLLGYNVSVGGLHSTGHSVTPVSSYGVLGLPTPSYTPTYKHHTGKNFTA